MTVILYLFIIIFGLIIGSFLNVVILRFNTGRKLDGRSHCLACSKTLGWQELIPVWSFLQQQGKCKHCQTNISKQYIAVEIVTAIIFALVFWRGMQDIGLDNYFGLIRFLIASFTIVSILLVIAVYDLRHKIIPDNLVYALVAVSALNIFIIDLGVGIEEVVWLVHGLFSGALLFFAFWALWHYSDGRLMGLGDGKLVFALGLWLGFKLAFAGIFLSFILGAIMGLALMYIPRYVKLPPALKKINFKTEIPFASFLVLGALISFILNFDVFSLF